MSGIQQTSSSEIVATRVATVSTTNNTPTVIDSIPIASGQSVLIETRIIARKTSGTGTGAVGDSNGYVRTVKAKNVGGVVTSGVVQSTFTNEDIASFTASIVVSGTNMNVVITGSANNNINWKSYTKVYTL